VEDAPWRNGVVQQVIDDVKSGKLDNANAARDALLVHAPASRPTNPRADRSTPEGAITALLEAVENGDEAIVADSFRVARESDGGAMRRQLAARLVADRKLAKALLGKFGPDQGARLVRDCSLGTKEMWLGGYRDAAWVVDGDVARAALDRPTFYD